MRVREAVHEAAGVRASGYAAGPTDELAADLVGEIRFREFAIAFRKRAHLVETSNVIQLRIAFAAFDRDGEGAQ